MAWCLFCWLLLLVATVAWLVLCLVGCWLGVCYFLAVACCFVGCWLGVCFVGCSVAVQVAAKDVNRSPFLTELVCCWLLFLMFLMLMLLLCWWIGGSPSVGCRWVDFFLARLHAILSARLML